MNQERMEEYELLSKAESYRLIDFDRAEIMTLETFPPQFVLIVSGEKAPSRSPHRPAGT